MAVFTYGCSYVLPAGAWQWGDRRTEKVSFPRKLDRWLEQFLHNSLGLVLPGKRGRVSQEVCHKVLFISSPFRYNLGSVMAAGAGAPGGTLQATRTGWGGHFSQEGLAAATPPHPTICLWAWGSHGPTAPLPHCRRGGLPSPGPNFSAQLSRFRLLGGAWREAGSGPAGAGGLLWG